MGLVKAANTADDDADDFDRPWAEADALFKACALGVGRRATAAEVRDRLAGHRLSGDLRRALELALLGPGAQDSGIIAEDVRQAMLLGGDHAQRAFAERLRGRDPAEGQWLERRQLLGYLRWRRDRRRGLLPVALALLALLGALALTTLHFRTPSAYGVLTSVASGARLSNITTAFPESAWTWLRAHGGRRTLAPGSEAVGGIRVRPLQTGAEPPRATGCDVAPADYARLALGLADRGRLDGQLRRCAASAAGRRFWLRAGSDAVPEAVEDIRRDMQAHGELGLAVQLLAWNSEVEFYALHEVAVLFDSSGLHRVAKTEAVIDSRHAWNSGRPSLMLVLDIFFLLACVPFFEAVALVRRCRRKGWRRCGERPGARSAAVWLNRALALLLAVHYARCEFLTVGLNDLVRGLPASAEGSSAAHEDTLDAVLERALHLKEVWSELRWYSASLIVGLCALFLIAAEAVPQLSTVTTTLRRTCVDIFHLMIVLFVIICVFVLVAHLTFGTRVKMFSDIGPAFGTTLLFMQCYKYDDTHRAMREQSGTLGLLWFWAFNIGLVLLFLRLILAAMFSVYSQVKAELAELAKGPGLSDDALLAGAGWIRAPSPEDADQKREALARARAAWSEGRVHARLVEQGPPDEEGLVSSAALALELGAEDWAEQLAVHAILVKAAWHAEELLEPSPADSLRLAGRVDANAQDLSDSIRALGTLWGELEPDGGGAVAAADDPGSSELLDGAVADLLEERLAQVDQTCEDRYTELRLRLHDLERAAQTLQTAQAQATEKKRAKLAELEEATAILNRRVESVFGSPERQ